MAETSESRAGKAAPMDRPMDRLWAENDDSRASGDPALVVDVAGFEGLLMSDDTSMKALSGDFPSKATAILAAGCDIVLHCNGEMEEMAGIASRTTGLEGTSLERARRALDYIKDRDTADEAEVRAEFATYFETMVA